MKTATNPWQVHPRTCPKKTNQTSKAQRSSTSNRYKTALLLLTLSSSSLYAAAEDDFVMTIQSNYPGTENPTQFFIETLGDGYNYNVDCNDDGILEATAVTGNYTCEYSTLPGGRGIRTLRISDNSGNGSGFPRIYSTANSTNSDSHNVVKILSLDQWGTGKWTNMGSAFRYASNMQVLATDTPDLSGVSDMSQMFNRAERANPDTRLWNVSNVTNMDSMFIGALIANPDVSLWDVSSVTNMTGMFAGAEAANPDVSAWNVANVTDMNAMFAGTELANPDVSAWDVSSVTDMGFMFWEATSSSPDISQWDVSSVINMEGFLTGISVPKSIYDQTLINWSQLNLQSNVNLDAGDSTYCVGDEAKQSIISSFNWNIMDAGRSCAALGDNSIPMHLSQDGTGQVLIFPYYTVNSGINTLISISNTKDTAKAVRVRFREAANSREVFSFNVYLGPNDMWTGGMYKNANDLTELVSIDQSCTIPAQLSGSEFTNSHYTGANADNYGQENKRLHEGFIEVFEMGEVIGTQGASLIADEDGIDCNSIYQAWDASQPNPFWRTDPSIELSEPTGGLSGAVTLIEVTEGYAISEPVTAINDFTDDILHTHPENQSPNLADAQLTSAISHLGSLLELNWPSGIEAVSSLLMKSDISGEYALDFAINAQTEWILTLPTQQFYRDTSVTGTQVPIAPFTSIASPTQGESFVIGGLFDREENAPTDPPGNICGVCPPTMDNQIPELYYATNSISFSNFDVSNTPSSIYTSNYGHDIDTGKALQTPYMNGWININFSQFTSNGLNTDDSNAIIGGLPITGFSTQRYTNQNAQPGLLAQYAGSFELGSNTWMANVRSETGGMQISDSNKGQVLLFPYYTVRNDLNSIITLVNTTDQVKAVKVRFREGRNNRNVLDFPLYLSPYDVWVAGLVAVSSTVPGYENQQSVKLVTPDSSCTVPAINNQEFLPWGFDPSGNADLNGGYDGLGADLSRVTEGSLEIIEMGIVIGVDAFNATHVPGGIPNCGALVGNWTPPTGQWFVDSSVNIVDPDGSGGLSATMSIIDVGTGYDMTYDATAIIGYSVEQKHSAPGNDFPTLADAHTTTLISTRLGQLQTHWENGADAITALFMKDTISNDFVIESGINASTEWVNFSPTKQFYTDPVFSNSETALAPFSSTLNAFGSCEQSKFKAFDREQKENSDYFPIQIDPPPPNFSVVPLDCYGVTTARILTTPSNTETIFDSENIYMDFGSDGNYPSWSMPFESGWMQKDFLFDSGSAPTLSGTGPDGETHTFYGLPVLGFVAQRYKNGTLNGGNTLANYGLIQPNRFTRKVEIQGQTVH